MVLACCQGYATLCRVLTNAWLIAAVVFSCLAVTSCEFLTRGDAATFGLFSYGVNGECSEAGYENGFDHGWLHTWAAICGILAPILGVIVLLYMTCDCFCKVCCSGLMQTVLLSCAELCQAFTFLMYASDACATESGNIADSSFTVNWEGCNIGTGSTYSFIAFCCFFLGGCWLCLSPKHDPLFCQKDDEPGEEKPQEEAASTDVETPAADPSSPPAEEEKPSAQVY